MDNKKDGELPSFYNPFPRGGRWLNEVRSEEEFGR